MDNGIRYTGVSILHFYTGEKSLCQGVLSVIPFLSVAGN